MAPPPNTNLYCTQCDSQVGILENEWERLTASYAKPKEKCLTFGLEVGEKTQVVPHGSAQKAAEGCMMAEVFCKKCSTTVAQYCKSAPHPSKEYLVNEQYFKLSRVYLKDAQTSEKVEPTFVDADCASSQARPASVRSSIPPPPPPKRRASSVHESAPTTAFRQSYPPPPTHALNNSQSQPSPTPLLTRFDGAHTPQAFALPVAQPSQYGYQQQQQFYDQASVSDPFQAMSANGIPALPREVVEQGAAIEECFHRLTTLAGRIGSEALRTTALETRMTSTENKATVQEAVSSSARKILEQLQTDHTTQATGYLLQNEKIQRQQTMIEDQQKELKNVTEKLESLQKSMKELTSTMEENRTQSLVQGVSQPDSRDFLINLEVMMRAMRDARPNDDEVKALRDENQAMKARLKSIASAMGTASEEDQAHVVDRASSQEFDDLHVLGKRKRALNKTDQLPRKSSRQASELVAASHLDEPLIPNPDPTRPESRSLAGPQLCATENDKLDVRTKRSASDDSHSQAQDDDDGDFVMIGNDGDESIERETPAAALEETGDSRSAELLSQAEETSVSNRESAFSSRSPAAADIHQAHYTNDPPLPLVDAQGNQLVHIQRSESGLNNGWESVPFYGPYPPTPWYGTPVRPAQYRPSFNSRGPGTHFLSGPGAMPTYFGSTIFPASQITPPYSAYISSAGQRSSLSGSDTFSGAISRGQRLEEIIQRPARSSTVTNIYPSHRADVRATVLKQRQSSVSEKPTPERPNNANGVGKAESTDFSDEENEVPPGRSTTGPGQWTDPTSTTPVGEPRHRVSGGTLVSRTVRGFTLEPLERPVINEPPPMPKPKPNTDAFRRSDGSRPTSVMPEILAAIQNLNGSAARHAARPNAIVPSLHLSAAGTAVNVSAADDAKKSRKSEAAPRISVDIVHHNSGQTKQSTSGVQEENANVSAPSKQAVSAINPSPTSDKAVAGKDNTQAPTSTTRGRPRKSGRPSDLQTRKTDQASATRASTDKNDDDCAVCGKGGNVLCCDGCPKVYHHRCLDPPMNPKDKLEGDWFCPSCIESQERKRKVDKDTALKLQLREQVLMERNRLAQEVMDQENAAERHRR